MRIRINQYIIILDKDRGPSCVSLAASSGQAHLQARHKLPGEQSVSIQYLDVRMLPVMTFWGRERVSRFISDFKMRKLTVI